MIGNLNIDYTHPNDGCRFQTKAMSVGVIRVKLAERSVANLQFEYHHTAVARALFHRLLFGYQLKASMEKEEV